MHTSPEEGMVSLESQGRAGSLVHLATFAEPLPGAGDSEESEVWSCPGGAHSQIRETDPDA